MADVLRCPRGHELEDDAVLCTVCWVRVVPEDPEVVAARRRQRRRRIWLPFAAASAIAVGAVVGATLASSSSPQPAVVAAEAPATAASVPAPAPVGSAEAVVVVAQPEAATIADPVTPEAGDCTVSALEQDTTCAVDGDALTFGVCVPSGTSTVEVRTRPDEAGEWQDVSSTVTLGASDACDAGQTSADVEVSATAVTAGAKYRLVGKDAAGEKLWKSKLVVSAP